jgi:hypothetical protein
MMDLGTQNPGLLPSRGNNSGPFISQSSYVSEQMPAEVTSLLTIVPGPVLLSSLLLFCDCFFGKLCTHKYPL